jgi:hydroxymethylglutaryl-CoA lyase
MKIIECPRDAMQGIINFIPTDLKIQYINQLLKIGFDTIDFGSFVSPKVMPQMRDTNKVLSSLDLSQSLSRLLAIVANERGAKEASFFDEVSYLGYPLSVSEIFQKRNTNTSIDQSLIVLENIYSIAVKKNKKLVVYLSMAFGNPYSEVYHPDKVAALVRKLNCMKISTIALSDTVGVSNPNNITTLFDILISEYPDIEFGAHFHSTSDSWREKIDAAYKNGCRRFDSTLKGIGGCPMADNKLIGNIPTEKVISYFKKDLDLNEIEFSKALKLTSSIF